MEEQKEVMEVVLTATLKNDGSVKVECPMLPDKIFMYGFIEVIKLAIIQSQIQHQSPIVRPKGGMINFVRNRLNG